MNRIKFIAAICLSFLATVSITTSASAQNSTIQLPTFHQFSVSTTVSVPDRGGAFLGGINHSGSFSNSRGVPLLPGGHRSRSSYRSAAQASAHVWIHDLEAVDRAILSQDAANQTLVRNQALVRNPASRESQTADKRASDSLYLAVDQSGARSVAQHRQSAHEAQKAMSKEVQTLITKALCAEKASKPGAARIYYRMAQRRAGKPQQQAIQKRLVALSKP